MKALSIRQPWAWAILNAGKRIENRSWAASFRGPFLIHAAQGCTLMEYEEARRWGPMVPHTLPRWKGLVRGGIVGRARIVDCVTESDSPWFVGPFGFVLEDVEPLPFALFKGSLGFFEVPDEVWRGAEGRA